MSRERTLAALGYAGFFLAWFVLFAYWTFPYERVADRLTKMVKESDSGYEVAIGSLSPYWLSGIEVEDVQVFETGAEAAAMAAPAAKPQPSFVLDEGRARLSLLWALLGTRSINFDLDLEHGEVEGNYSESADEREIEAELSEVDLGRVPLLQAVPLPMRGTFGGEVDLTIGADPSKSSGSMALDIEGLVVGDGEAKLALGMMGGLTIDPIDVGDIHIDVEIKDGVGKVKELRSTGKDMTLGGEGEIRLLSPLARSRVELLLSLRISDTYKNKSDRTKALFALLDGGTVPQLRSARDDDGAYHFKLLGTLASLRAVPAAASAARER